MTQDPNILGDWLVVGEAAKLRAGTSLKTRLAGKPIEIARGPDGRLRGEYAVQERYGHLWVCMGKAQKPLFELAEYDQPGRRILNCGGIGVAACGLRVIENFLDVAHLAYVHTDLLGKEPYTEVTDYKVEVDQRGEIWARDVKLWQPKAAVSASEAILASYDYRVMQPFSTMLYKTSPARPAEMDIVALFVQPLDETNSIAYCLLAYFDDTSPDRDLIAFQQTIFGQDKPILENHRPQRLPLEGRLETPARCDATSVAYRRWLRGRNMRYGVHAVD